LFASSYRNKGQNKGSGNVAAAEEEMAKMKLGK